MDTGSKQSITGFFFDSRETAMMTSSGFFITGTDTEIGKTVFSLALVRYLNESGVYTLGMKPVASGGVRDDNDYLRNADALALQQHSPGRPVYQDINPICFEEPVAPHLAANQVNQVIRFDVITAAFRRLRSVNAFVVVEGVGGWRVPLGDAGDVADLAKELSLPVILVVGMRLGCLNHAILSVRDIEISDCCLLGWVANCCDPSMPYLDENIATLDIRLPAPRLATLPWSRDPDKLDLSHCLALNKQDQPLLLSVTQR